MKIIIRLVSFILDAIPREGVLLSLKRRILVIICSLAPRLRACQSQPYRLTITCECWNVYEEYIEE